MARKNCALMQNRLPHRALPGRIILAVETTYAVGSRCQAVFVEIALTSRSLFHMQTLAESNWPTKDTSAAKGGNRATNH